MTPQELKDVQQLIYALKRVEWVDGKCPWCSRPQNYGAHVCSCPRRLGLLKAQKNGWMEGTLGPDQEIAALISALRQSAEGVRDALSYSGGHPEPGSLVVEQAADILESWNGQMGKG